MLWTIFVILLVLWLLGLVSAYTFGGFIPYPPGTGAGGPRVQLTEWAPGRALSVSVPHQVDG